jgi:hypothetical protein
VPNNPTDMRTHTRGEKAEGVLCASRRDRYADQRNVLTLCYSEDLFNWTIVGTLLRDDTGLSADDSVRYTGFHYVDWQLDGDDLLYLVRTAYRGAVSYHNSNRITFKRLAGFRQYLPPVGTGGSNATAPAAALVKLDLTASGFVVRALAVGALAFTDRTCVCWCVGR